MFTGIKQSIADQTGNFSFQFGVIISDLTKQVNIGFTGSTNLNWSLYQGKIYDNRNYYCGSYLANQNTFISGNVAGSIYDYYINGEVAALGQTRNTGIINYFYVNSASGNKVSFTNTIVGTTPAYTLNSNINFYTGQLASGLLINNSQENFRIFSGSSTTFNIFYSGNTTGNISPGGTGYFYNVISGASVGSITSGNYTLYTNFGNINTNLFFNATQNPSSGLTIFNYNSIGNISGAPANQAFDMIGISLNTISGFNFINTPNLDVQLIYSSGFTGNYTPSLLILENVSGLISGNIIGSGLYSGYFTGIGSGISPVNGSGYTGLVSGEIYQELYYTGAASGFYTILSSGLATGLISGSLVTGLATGYISGYVSGIINNGGIYNFNNYNLIGTPSILFFTGFKGSGLNPITSFTGLVNGIVTGSGFNIQYINGQISGYIYPVSYLRSFTGAWDLSTGISSVSLINFYSNNQYIYNKYYNLSGPLSNFSGNSLYVKVSYTPYFDTLQDVAQLIITGLNSGINIFITGQRI